MIAAIGDALTMMITSAGEVVTALVTENGALANLLPAFAIGIGASLLLFGVKCIKSVVWGA